MEMIQIVQILKKNNDSKMKKILGLILALLVFTGLNFDITLNKKLSIPEVSMTYNKMLAQSSSCAQCRTSTSECIRIKTSSGYEFIYYGNREECEEFPDIE